MRASKILLLVHPKFRPDCVRPTSKTELDVWKTLKRLYDVQVVPLLNDLNELDRSLSEGKVDIAFNLLEEFKGEAVFDFHPITYLEAKGIPVTGCNPRGLVQSRNKYLISQVARSLEIRSPKTLLVRTQGDLKRLEGSVEFPVIVKLNREHASLGLYGRSVVRSKKALVREIHRLWDKYGGEVLVQEFIEGHDVSVSICGNRNPQVFEPRRLVVNGKLGVATERAKFSVTHQRRNKMRSIVLQNSSNRLLSSALKAYTRKLFLDLDLSGYARMDFRVNSKGEAFLLDVNANPNLARNEDFALSAMHEGIDYESLLAKILKLAVSYKVSI